MTSSAARFYNNKIANDPEFYANEKQRVTAYMKNRYNTDEEYKEKRKEYCRIKMKELYQKRKLEKLQQQQQEVQ
jgi:pyrroloquinoline quinone (PQQ) biosynthesis protein C